MTSARSAPAILLACMLVLTFWHIQAVPAAGAVGGVPAAGAGGGRAGRAGAGGTAAVALNLAFYTTEFDTMSQILTLTDEQKPKLQEKINTMNRELDQFVQGAQPQITAARRGARGARGGAAGAGAAAAGGRGGRGAAAGALAGSPVIVGLQDQLQELANLHQVLIDQSLTPEQRLTWEGYKLTRVLDPRLQTLALSDDQKDKVKTLVDDAAKTIAGLADGKTITELQGKLYRKIVSDVLTDVQAGKLMSGVLPVQQPAAGRGAVRGAAGPGGGAAAPAGGLPPAMPGAPGAGG